jgi:hypothetical protein
MIQLNAGNVLLKPSQRRQILAALRRAMKFGQRLGNFTLNLTLHRTGRSYELRANVRDRSGQFTCRARRNDWRDAVREMTRMLVARLHGQWVMRSVA